MTTTTNTLPIAAAARICATKWAVSGHLPSRPSIADVSWLETKVLGRMVTCAELAEFEASFAAQISFSLANEV
jgi:hypothetical protein